MATPTLAERAAAAKARSLSTTTPAPVAPATAPPSLQERAAAAKARSLSTPAPKPPEVKATPVAKPKPVAPVVVTAPKAAPSPPPAPVVAAAPAAPAAFTPVPIEQWIKMTPEQRQGALATRAAQPGFTSTLTRLEAESAPPPVAAKAPAAPTAKPIKPAPEFYPGEETPVPTLLSPAPAFSMGPDGKPVTDWRMPTAEEQAHAEAQKGRAQIETDLAIAKKRLAEQEASHRFGEAPWWLPGTDPLVTARDEVRHLEALKAQGVDPLRPPSASEELVAGAKALHKYLTTSPEDKPLSADAVETEIANRRTEAQRMGQTLPDPRDENRFREDNRVRRQQLELSQAASARQSYEEQALAAKNDPYKLAAIQNEEATRLGVVSRAVARVVPQAVIDGRAAMLNISAKAQLDPDPTSAGQKFLKEASDYIYAQGQADAPNTDEGRAALRARANAGAWDMLLSLRQQGPQFWPYPIYERDFVPASERTYWGTAKDILLPEVETVPGGGAVRTQGLVSHAFALLGLPGAAGGQLLRQSLGGDVDWYRTLRHKTSAVERVSLDAENVPLLKHAIDNTDFTSAEGASNGAFVLGVAATAATFDVLGDFLSIFGGLAEGVRALGVAKKAVALGKEAKLAGRSAEEVIRVVQESVGKSAFEVADLLEKEAAALPAKDSVLAARKRSAAETIRMRATEVVKSDAGGGNSVLTSLREIDQSTAIHPEEVRAALPQLKEEAKKATDAVNAITAERETLTAEREAAKATASPEDWDGELKAGFDASSRDVGARLRTAENRKLQFDTAVDSIESGRYDQVYDIANQQAKKGVVDELSLTGKGAVPATPVSALGFPEAPAPAVPPPPSVNEIVAAFGEDVTTVGGKTQRIVTAKTASEALIAARMGGKNTEAVEKLSKDLLVHMTASDPAVAQVVQRLRDADAARVASKGGKPASETQILQKALGKQTRDAAAQMAVKARQKVVQAEAKVEHIKRLQETNTQFAAQKKAFDVAQKNMEKILSEAEAASVAAETEAAAKRAAEAVPPAAPLKGKKKATVVAPAPAEVAPVEVPPAPVPVITPTKVESVVGAPAGQAEVPDETGMLGRALETLSPLKAQQRRTRFDLSRLDFGPSGEPFLLPHMVYTPKAKYAARQQVHLAYLAFERDALAGTDKALGKYLVGVENADFARNNGLPHLDKYMTPTETYRFTASIDGAPPEPYNYYTVRKLDLNKQAAQAMPVYHTVTPGELTWTPAADAFLNDIAKVAAAHPERQTANTMNNFLRSLLPFSDVKAVEKDAHTLIRLEDQVRVDSVAAGNNIEAYRLPERKADEADAVMSKPAAFVGKVTGFTADGKVIVQPYEFRIGSRELDYTSPQRIKPVTVDPAEMRYQERGRRPRNRTMRTMTDAEWSELRAREDKMPGARTLRYDPSTTGWMQKLNPPARPTKDSYYFAVENLADDVDRQAALLEKHNALYRGVPTPAPGEVPLAAAAEVAPPRAAPLVEPPAVAPKGKGKGKATPVAEPVVEPAKPPVVEPVAPKLPAGPTKAEIEAAEFELGMAQNELEKAREAKSARGKKVLAQKLQEAETAVEEAKRAHAAEQALQDATEKMEKVANDVLTPALGERIPVAEGLEKTRLGEEALAAFKERKARLLEMAGGNVPQTVTPARAIYEQQVREVYARLGRDPALADAQLQATNAIADAMHAQYPDEFPTTDAVYSRVVHEIGTKEQQAAEAAGFLAGTAPEDKLAHWGADDRDYVLQSSPGVKIESVGPFERAPNDPRFPNLRQPPEGKTRTEWELEPTNLKDFQAKIAAIPESESTADSYLRVVLESTYQKEVYAVAETLLKDQSEFLRNLKVRHKSPNLGGFAGLYEYETRSIIVSPRRARPGTVVHEIVHALTFERLATPDELLSPAMRAAKNNIKTLWSATRKAYSGQLWYGLKNVDEFVAEAFSNPEFMYFLKNTPIGEVLEVRAISEMGQSVPKTLWDRFVSSLAELLGFKDTDVLGFVVAQTNVLFEDVRKVGAGPSYEDIMRAAYPQPATTSIEDAVDAEIYVAGLDRDAIYDQARKARDAGEISAQEWFDMRWKADVVHRDKIAAAQSKLPHMTGTSLRGMANTADGTRTVLTFFANANAETLVHEPGHFLELVLPKKPKAIIEEALGVVDGNWTREQSEAFARQYTAFLLNGVQTGNVELDRSYSVISNSLKAVIQEGAAEVVHKDIADALTALTQFAEPTSVRTVGGGGNRERLLREFDILTQIRNTGTGTGPVNTARVVAGKVRDMLFMNTQERALRSLAPEVRRVIVMSEAEFDDLNRVIAEHLGKDTLISAVLDENPDPTWWNAFRDAVFNKSLTDNYDNIAFAYLDAKRFGRFTPEDVTTLRKIVSSGEYTSAQDLADRVYAASEALAAKATNPEALRPRNVGDALLVQSVGGIGIDQNLLKRGFGIGMTISKDSAQKAKMVFAGVAADRTQEGMRIIQNAIDDPFNYDKPIEKLYDAGTAAGFFKETTTEPFVSAGKFATEFAVALDGEAYVPRAVKDIMEKRWKEIASAQKMSEGGQVFFRAWKQALTAGYACVKPWYHWQNMFSDIEQIGSTIGLEAAMRTAASATLHSLVLGLGGQRVVSGATDVAIIGAQKLASKAGITTWLESGAWKMGDTMKKLDEVLAFGAFGKPTTNVLERTGKFITKEGIEYDNAALAKIFSASGVYESGLGNLDLVGQLNRLDQTGRAARGEVGLAARAKQNVVEAWRMNAAQVGNIATLIARRRKIGLCLTLMDMGYEPYEAAMLVKKSLFDMKHTLHDSEKGMWAFFNPFWAWKKENAARSLQDAMTAGGLRRMSIIHKTRETTARGVGYMLQTNPPTGFDVRSMKEDDQNRAESEKQWPKFQAILDSLHQPSEAYPQGLTDNDIKRMVAEPGWMTGNQPIAALAPYYSQYWMVNPTQAMLPDYVWDRVVIYATIPHTSDSYQLYTTGEGSKAKTFDQGRVVVLPEDANMAGLEVSVAAASSVIHAMYWAQGDPGAKARFNASIKKVIGDPTTNPAFVAIVNGALSYEDPENPPRDVKLPPGVGEALHTLGGDILSQVGKPVTTAGEGMGAEGQAKRTYTMPWLTDALLTGLDIAPIIKVPSTVETVYRAASGAVGVDAAENADIPYQVIELTTGQPIRTYSATQQQRNMRFQVDERVKEATAAFKPSAPLDEPIPQQPGAPTDRWLRFYQKVPLSATPSVDLDAYYEGTDTPKLIQQLAKTPGNESLLNVWKHWASVRAVAGIPKEQSNRGTFRQFYPIYLDALARDASAEELKNMLTVLDYNKYTQ